MRISDWSSDVCSSDLGTFTVTYVVHDRATSEAAVIDPVLDFDPASGRTSHTSADEVVEYVKSNNLKVSWLLETHAHADHLSAAPYLQQKLGGKIAIGEHRSEEHTSELQSLMRISYAVFC